MLSVRLIGFFALASWTCSGQFKQTKHIHRCELYALTAATKIADVYNTPNELINNEDPDTNYVHDIEERMYQDYIVEHLGFVPYFAKGVSSDIAKGKTTSGVNVASVLMKRNHWIGTDLEHSAYAVFKDLWIYMVGDSTTRQMWSNFANPLHGSGFGQNSKEWSREHCAPQWPHHRKHHHGGGSFPDEGWSGNCGNNELTCHIQGFGKDGILTFDWKHFPWEDYDEYLWGATGPFGERPEGMSLTSTVGHEAYANRSSVKRDKDSFTSSRRRLEAAASPASPTPQVLPTPAPTAAPNSENAHRALRRPDVLTIQTGLHTCVHARYTARDARNHTQEDRYIADLLPLMQNVRAVVNKRDAAALAALSASSPSSAAAAAARANHRNTTVIWVTSGRVGHRQEGLPMSDHDECVWRFNAFARRLAHRFGFAVLEREEIERRLLFVSQNHEKKVPKGEHLRFKMHLESPAPQIVATGLLLLARCLRNESFFGDVGYVQSPFGTSESCRVEEAQRGLLL